MTDEFNFLETFCMFNSNMACNHEEMMSVVIYLGEH